MLRRAPLSLSHAGPFLKWAGGKGRLLEAYAPLFPSRFERYFEPFVGAGAVFFYLAPAIAELSDMNSELVVSYQMVRDHVEELIERLGDYRYERDFYYEIRESLPASLDDLSRAARMIYLNKTCFNGLYRVNRQGRFNVPFGSYKNPKIVDPEALRAASHALKGVVVEQRPFEAVLERAGRGDFVYFDPPYHPLSSTAKFTSYAADDFKPQDQARLAEVFATLDRRGCKVMLSNSDTPFIRELFTGYPVDTVYAPRAISRDGAKRQPVREVVVRNYR